MKEENQVAAVNESTVEVVDQENVIILRKPLKDGDTVHDRLYLNLDGLDVNQIIRADADLSFWMDPQEKALIVMKQTNFAYHMAIAARACGLTYDVMGRLNAKDALDISQRVQTFLLT
ncbi:hypothetical protein [Paenibacillus pabuli]|uniref:hypothetical protein n=1 Tax=Paenibacillus pabuli TaxID=1472 RepID=UPI001FFEFDD2|nr:hypothetical protein [Paenibacillus pabuli]UPK45893.1 hypothetical protein KET34_10755 [Paenibacillus pabuli]